MIKNEFKSYKYEYLILLIGIVIFIISFLNAWPNKTAQRFIAIFFSIFYFLWGTILHILHDDFNKKIFLEYLSFSVLGIVILYFMLLF